MNLQQLVYFQKIAECEQYTIAARELHVTQATLSYAISNLEHELGAPLFDRHGKHVSLTGCGETYLKYVNSALQSLDIGAQAVKNLSSSDRRVLKVSCLESVNNIILRLLAEKKDKANGSNEPLFRFDLAHHLSSEIEKQIIRREVDLAISTAPKSSDIASYLIGYNDNVVIVSKSHPWAGRKSVKLSELTGQNYIAYSVECNIRGYYDDILGRSHSVPTVFAETKFHTSIMDMVGFNMGVSIVPHMHSLAERQDLAILSIEDPIPARPIYLLWLKGAQLPPEAEMLRNDMIEYMKDTTIIE